MLGESLPLVGTPFSLEYSSDRMNGRREAYSLRVPLTGSTIPASLKAVVLEVRVAGRIFSQRYPATVNQVTTFAWDGHDAYGREVQGKQRAFIRTGYVYEAEYQESPADFDRSFGRISGVPFTPNRIGAREDVTLWSGSDVLIGDWNARAFELGGWSLDAHNAYDATGHQIYQGDGTARGGMADDIFKRVATPGALLDAETLGIATAPNGDIFAVDYGFSSCFCIKRIRDGVSTVFVANERLGPFVEVGPDGSVYFTVGTDYGGSIVKRVSSDGSGMETVAGSGQRPETEGGDFGEGDGGPAISAPLIVNDIEVGPDGTIYLAAFLRVRKVSPDGRITTVAGNGDPTYYDTGDNGPAKDANLGHVGPLALADDGTLYITSKSRVRQIQPNGIISAFAGDGTEGASFGDGGPAVDAKLDRPWGLAVGPDDSVYVTEFDSNQYNDQGGNHIRRITPDGIITTIAGSGARCDIEADPTCGSGGGARAARLTGPFGWTSFPTARSCSATAGRSARSSRRSREAPKAPSSSRPPTGRKSSDSRPPVATSTRSTP